MTGVAAQYPTPLDDAILWLVVKHPPMTRSAIARVLKRKGSNVTHSMNRLAHKGYIDHGRGSCIPTPKALSYVDKLAYDQLSDVVLHKPKASPSTASRLDTGAARHTPEPACAVVGEYVHPEAKAAESYAAEGLAQPPMEPRDSIAPSTSLLIAALAGFQDPLLQQANAQLRLRVTELEERVALLTRDRDRALRLLAQAADALTD